MSISSNKSVGIETANITGVLGHNSSQREDFEKIVNANEKIIYNNPASQSRNTSLQEQKN